MAKIKIKKDFMLLDRETLTRLIFYYRQRIDLPTDDHTKVFIENAPIREIIEIWDGLKELVNIFQNVGSRTFAFCEV